ncbi:MAG: hypothetical protein JRC92_09660 [Deltaproteobacteria bacterium]|nr:hypothetical protein [Deltaproteobacteria bacterium]
MNTVLRLVLPILPQLLGLITPLLRESLEGGIKDLQAKAKTTDNPIDDILVAVLAGAVGLELDA